MFEVVQLGEFARANPRLEPVRNRIDLFAHSPRPMSITKR